jgi:hypothetical protein
VKIARAPHDRSGFCFNSCARADIMGVEVRMRAFATASFVLICLGCSSRHGHGTDGNGSGSGVHDACVGLQCQVVNCEAMNMPPTTITGKVFAPNGTLPLFGINVYVPNSDPGPMPTDRLCSQCTDTLPGSPVGKPVQTGDDGSFTLTDMPSGANIPLVIVSGKWRRILNINNVAQCAPTMIATADTRLPKSIDDMTPNTKMCGSGPCVDMPKIAVTTGGCDQLECLVRKLGVADKEITNKNGAGHLHLYTGTGGTPKFDAAFANGQGGQSFTSATDFWGGTMGTPDTLANYDIVMLSCECGQNVGTKPQMAVDAVKKYADTCGRLFASHWHNIWIGGNFQPNPVGTVAPGGDWTSIATWTRNDGSPGMNDLIDEVNNPKGTDFATWMLDPLVAGTPPTETVRDQIPLNNQHSTCTGLDNTKAERWTYGETNMHPQNFQFTTPNELPPDQRGGKVVYSDMHVSGTASAATFPAECAQTNDPTGLALTAQEKALAFMFFDISSCVITNIP